MLFFVFALAKHKLTMARGNKDSLLLLFVCLKIYSIYICVCFREIEGNEIGMTSLKQRIFWFKCWFKLDKQEN